MKKESQTILAIVAHADDEALGCGGTLARHAANGDTVHIIIMADGVTSRAADAKREPRNNSCFKVAEMLGAQKPILMDLPDNKMDSVPLLDIVQKIEPVIFNLKPDIVYTHHGNDLNVDHVITHKALLTVLRSLPGGFVKAIYAFEVLSSTEWSSPHTGAPFVPDHYVDISAHMEKKMQALKAYDEEMRPFPHARSYEAVQALAILRGAQSGLKAAESFSTIRSFWR